MAEAKFVPIAIGAVPESGWSGTPLHALDVDSRVWAHDASKAMWRAVPDRRAATEAASAQGIDEPAGPGAERPRPPGRMDSPGYGRPKR